MAYHFYTVNNAGDFKNKVAKVAIDKATWDGLTTLICKKGSIIQVLDHDGSGLHRFYSKKDNTDHSIATGFVIKAEGGGVDHFKGVYASLTALQTAYPTASLGDWAEVDPGTGVNVIVYYWDAQEGWVASAGSVPSTSQAQAEGAARNNSPTGAVVLNNTERVTPLSLYYFAQAFFKKIKAFGMKFKAAFGFYLVCLGDSNMAEEGSTGSVGGLARIFCDLTGMVMYNKAQGGANGQQVLKQLITPDSVIKSVNNVIHFLINLGTFNLLLRSGGTPSGALPNQEARTFTQIANDARVIMAKLWTYSGKAVSASTLVITDLFYRVGPWSARAASTDYPSPAESNFSGTGMQVSAINSSIFYKWSTGRRPVIYYVGNDQAATSVTMGSFAVYINNILIQTVNCNNQTVYDSTYPSGFMDNKYGLCAVVLPAFGKYNTSTDVLEIRTLDNNLVIIDSIGEMQFTTDCAKAMFQLCLKADSIGYAKTSLGADRPYVANDALVDRANDVVMQVYLDTFAGYDGTFTDLNNRNVNVGNPDHIHLNDSNHAQAALELVSNCVFESYRTLYSKGQLSNATATLPTNSTAYVAELFSAAVGVTASTRQDYVNRPSVIDDIDITFGYVPVAGSSIPAIDLMRNGSVVLTVASNIDTSVGSGAQIYHKSLKSLGIYYSEDEYWTYRITTGATVPTSFTIDIDTTFRQL